MNEQDKAFSVAATDIWQPAPGVLVTDLEHELVVLQPQTAQLYQLNKAGRLLWLALPATTASLEDLLVGAYGLSAQVARQDILTLLGHLAARQLIVRDGAAAVQ